jgi:tetratricopeptide (TPR) repeat protein
MPKISTKRTGGVGMLRWGLRTMVLALVVLNAWWLWGDRATPGMKAIGGLIARGRLDEAERALEWRLRWSSGDGEARMELARLLIKRGDYLAGARQLHEVPFWWPGRGEASFLEGQSFKRADRAREAEAAWKACIADDPLHPLPSRMFHGSAKDLVTLYLLEGRLDEARQILWRAYDEATPEEKPGVLATRVRLELERIDHAEAVGRLREYLAADPDDHDARRALAIEEHATGDEASADRDLDVCLRNRPDDPLAWRARLEILKDRGDVTAFHEAIGRLPGTTGDDPKIWVHRGMDREREGDKPGALEAFRRSVKLAPNDAEALYKLGMAELALGLAAPGREHVAGSRQLHRAYEALRDGYQTFLEQAGRNPRDEAGYRSAVERLATTCRTLGWPREADAWLAQRPGG